MPDFLRSALESLPEAAKNPISFVGYLAALGCWVAIAWRVRRNKQLLKNIDKLPPADRLPALTLEMGGIPIPAGLSPEQWIRARIHRYYFLGFAIVCALAVIILALALFSPHRAEPFSQQKLGIEQLDLGLRRDNVVSLLGVSASGAHFAHSTCEEYRFPFAYLMLLYNEHEEVVYFLVVSKEKGFHPHIPMAFVKSKQLCLGCASFSEIVPEGIDLMPVYFNFSAHLWTYTESLPEYGRASNNHSVYISFLGEGVDYGSTIPTSDVLEKVATAYHTDRSLSEAQKTEFRNFRTQTRPNAFAVFSTDDWSKGPKSFGLPLYLNLPDGSGEDDCKGCLADLGF